MDKKYIIANKGNNGYHDIGYEFPFDEDGKRQALQLADVKSREWDYADFVVLIRTYEELPADED